MLWTLLHRSIFYELFKVFLLAFLGLTGLLLTAGILAEATRSGLGLAQIVAAIPLLVPSTMPYTLPTTTLFATCIVYGRLANDSEILALRAAGVHIAHVMWPGVLLGTATGALTLVLYLDTIPITQYLLRTQIISDVEELLYGMLRKEGCIRHPTFNYEIFVKRVQGRKLLDAQFRRRDPEGQGFDVIAVAKEAELMVDMAHRQLLVRMRHCHVINENGQADVFFESHVVHVELPDDFGSPPNKTRSSSMTWLELFENRARLRGEQEDLDVQIAEHQAAINLGTAQPHFPQHVQALVARKQMNHIGIAQVESELNMRPALALGCLCFVLVGCPVGIWLSKSDYLSAFITCFLPIIIVYYPLMLCCINMARSGKHFPVAGIWAADAALIVVGAVMYRRLTRA